MSAFWDYVSVKPWFSWVCLFLIINPYFLCYYGYDSLGSILSEVEALFRTDKAGIGILYAVYSIPVIIAIFFIGITIDKFGTRKTAVVLSTLALLGAIFVAMGYRHFGLLILGRILFGLGSEAMSVTAQKMLSHRFRDSFLSLAFGFQILWGQLGSCAVFLLMPIFAERFGTIMALWTVPIYAIFSLVTTVAYCWIDWKYETVSKARHSPPVSRLPSASADENIIPTHHQTTLKQQQQYDTTPEVIDPSQIELNQSFPTQSRIAMRTRRTFPSELESSTSELLRSDETMSVTSQDSEAESNLEENLDFGIEIPEIVVVAQTSSKMELKDLKSLPLGFWILLVLYFSVSSSFFVWNSFGGDRLQQKYGYTPKVAGTVVALSNLAAMVSPLTGFIVDKIGHRTKFIGAGTGLMFIVYCAISWTDFVSPSLWYILLGVGVSLCQPIVFASVSLIVKDTIIGTAFSLMSLAMNFGQMALPPIIGRLHTNSGNYDSGNWVFVILGLVSVIFAFLLFLLDRRKGVFDTVIRPREQQESVESSNYVQLEVINQRQIEREI